MAELTDDRTDHRRRRRRDRCGHRAATAGSCASARAAESCWPPAASTTTWSGAKSIFPSSRRIGASAIPRQWVTASGRARRSAVRPTSSTRRGGFPAMCWPDGRLQFMLNERMMPSQFVVNGEGKRFVNEAAPYMDFAHAMIDGQNSGVTHIPCWLVTDIRSFHRYVVGGHLPIPKIPFAPVPTGWKVPKAWLESGVVQGGEQLRGAGDQDRRAPGCSFVRPPIASTNWRARATTTTSTAATALTTTTTATRRCPIPICIRCRSRRTTRSRSSSATSAPRVGCGPTNTPGCCVSDDSVVKGLYAVGNTSAAVMGRSYAGAGATIGPAMTFGYRGRQAHRRPAA